MESLRMKCQQIGRILAPCRRLGAENVTQLMILMQMILRFNFYGEIDVIGKI